MALLFPNKLMLQNASYKKGNKTKQNDYEKKKKVSPGGRRTWDLWRVRATRYPLPHATIVNIICQIIVTQLTMVKWSFSIDDGDGDGNENVTFKMKSRFGKLCRVYANSLKLSNVGEFSRSWLLGDRIQV